MKSLTKDLARCAEPEQASQDSPEDGRRQRTLSHFYARNCVTVSAFRLFAAHCGIAVLTQPTALIKSTTLLQRAPAYSGPSLLV